MSKLAIAGIVGSGGLGTLLAALIASSMLDLDITGIIGFAFICYVMAGAGGLILRNM
jgi:ABC-type phosphate/phosphonate transport system permease subunit